MTKGNFQPDPDCTDDCDDDHYWCYQDCFGAMGQPDECEASCDYDLDQCIDARPVICTGPSYRDYEETNAVGYLYLGPTQCLYDPFNTPVLYDFGRVTYETVEYRETTQCDGSKSTTVLSTNYWTRDCYARSSNYCGNPSGFWYNYITCN